MIIAFEGPDKVGKSTSAANVGHLVGTEAYNMTKESYEKVSKIMREEKGIVHAFDRIDWFTHMAYRLALPEHEWNDPRVRTVFAAPDTHLVFKVHHPLSAKMNTDELYGGDQLERVNEFYKMLASSYMALNEAMEFSLFKTVSLIEVSNIQGVHAGLSSVYKQHMVDFSTPIRTSWNTWDRAYPMDTDEDLVAFLEEDERLR